MAIREIRYQVTREGVIPASHHWGGVQGEDNATNVVYKFDEEYLRDLGELDNIRFRIDFNSASAGYEPSENLSISNSAIERAIPKRMTQNGGQITVTLVITRIVPDTPDATEVILQEPSTIFFTSASVNDGRFNKNMSAYEEYVEGLITKVADEVSKAESASESARESAISAGNQVTLAGDEADRAEDARDKAEEYKDEAELYASVATEASNNALQAETNAKTSEENALTYSNQASNLASIASGNADRAEDAQKAAEDARDDAQEYRRLAQQNAGKAQSAAESIRIYNPASINKHYSGFIAGTISASGVITEEYNGGSTQYFIKQYLEAGTYLYKTNYNVAGVASRRCFRYDENGAYLGSIVCEVVTDLGNGREINKFTLSEGKIIALRVGYINDTNDFMIIEGSTPEDWSNEYVPYYPEKIAVADDVNFGNSMRAENDVLWGKSIAVEGDSICAGNNIVGGYSRWLQYEHNMTVFNTAVGGSPITKVSGKPHIISEAVASMQAGCDYYIFNGGYNDRTLNVAIGELVDGFPLKDADNDTITTDTLAGAMEYACRDLVTIHNGAKCGFIFCHNRYALNDDYNTKYRPIMKAACEKWGVPYLDLQEQVPPFTMVQTLADKYTQSQDGTHPNWEGYAKYYVPKIVAWLKTL